MVSQWFYAVVSCLLHIHTHTYIHNNLHFTLVLKLYAVAEFLTLVNIHQKLTRLMYFLGEF